MKLTLTFEEGLKVVEAMRNAAIDNGWEPEEFDECGAIEEYGHMLDVAMKAMGIDFSVNTNPACEDEAKDSDEEDFDFNFDDEEDEDKEEDDEELPSDEEVMNLIKQVLYGQ